MDNNGSIHERITQLVNVFGKGKNTAFASAIGSNEANVRGYKTSVMPKFDFLEKIARCLDIDLKWLLTGEGSMLHTDTPQQPVESTSVSASSDAVALRLMDKLDEKDTLLKEKEAENKHLQSELRAMEKELATFKAHYQHSGEPVIAFTPGSPEAYTESSLLTKKPITPSKKLSAGKT